MANKYKGSKQSPAARSRYHGAKLISNPNAMKATYNSAGGFGSEYASRMNTVETTGQARKIALRKILHKDI